VKFLSGKTERPVTEEGEGGNKDEKKEKKRRKARNLPSAVNVVFSGRSAVMV
jgi:hypothetical protein